MPPPAAQAQASFWRLSMSQKLGMLPPLALPHSRSMHASQLLRMCSALSSRKKVTETRREGESHAKSVLGSDSGSSGGGEMVCTAWLGGWVDGVDTASGTAARGRNLKEHEMALGGVVSSRQRAQHGTGRRVGAPGSCRAAGPGPRRVRRPATHASGRRAGAGKRLRCQAQLPGFASKGSSASQRRANRAAGEGKGGSGHACFQAAWPLQKLRLPRAAAAHEWGECWGKRGGMRVVCWPAWRAVGRMGHGAAGDSGC